MKIQRYFQNGSAMIPAMNTFNDEGQWCKASDISLLEDKIQELKKDLAFLGASRDETNGTLKLNMKKYHAVYNGE